MKILLGVIIGFFSFILNAFAAVDVGVTTALSDAKTDTGTIAAAVFLILIVVATYRYLKKAL